MKPLTMAVIGLSVAVLAIIVWQYTILLGYDLASSSGAMNALVNADAALLGFLAILSVYVFSMLRDGIKDLKQERKDATLAHEDRMRHIGGLGASFDLDKESRDYEDRIADIDKRIRHRKGDARDTSILLFVSAFLIVVSILSSMLALSDVDAPVRFFSVAAAVATMICGLTIEFSMLISEGNRMISS